MAIFKMTRLRIFCIIMTQILLIKKTSSTCGGKTLLYQGVSARDKQLIVDTHNKMRQVVALGQIGNQPPAANMFQLTWSDDLARRAQMWAMACTPYTHDPGRHTTSYSVGQNIASKWTTRAPTSYQDMSASWASDAIDKWFAEYNGYRFSGYPSTSTGHYTQLIWADTTSVGCGYAFYLDGQKKYTKKYVCNYGPSGNVQGELPYKKGYPSCYSYGSTESRQYPGLCVGHSVNAFTKYDNNYDKFYNPFKQRNYGNDGYYIHVYDYV